MLKHEELSEDEVSGGFLTEQIIREVLDSLKTWQCSNSEPVGLLWHDMLKYVNELLTFSKATLQLLLKPSVNSLYCMCNVHMEGE